MRGIWAAAVAVGAKCGIIPAGAGHFFIGALNVYRVGDHPRRCGAFDEHRYGFPVVAGSSPQVRGIFYGGGVSETEFRIIPAGAGHLGLKKAALGMKRDHPRRCGAFRTFCGRLVAGRGSSPQVRGICRIMQAASACMGIIPAGAGHL